MSDGQPVRVKTPLGDDLKFKSMDWTDELGRLFRCEMELLSDKEDIELDDVLGKDMTVEWDLPNGETKYFHGWASHMSQAGTEHEHFCYSVVLYPWFWFLTQTADCRIFQEMTVPDIIKQIFRDEGFADFEDKLTASYRTWEYCVQYRETDFNFISRLMEQEGIYYYFRHEDGKDVLVMSDDYSAHSAVPGYEKIPFYPPNENAPREEHIFDWTLSRSVRTGAYVLNAYHFKKPRADLKVQNSISRKHAAADYEVFDYPGEYFEKSEGDAYVGTRIEELQAQYERVRGQTDAMGLFPGGLFELEEYPRGDQNREYLICATQQSLELGDYESGSSQMGVQFSCSFEAMYSEERFRAERLTPKPSVQGPQSAIVTGPSGEEIHTDEYGRIKVKFVWDRLGKSDENSSCWIRVAQVWAGSQWGGMAIPRIGQEVLVDFIEGDPDRPIVTGRVYNADNMPPYALPDNKTQTGIKSRSSKDGGTDNFNEIRFEDKMGEEEMYIHAEKDQNVVVENNQTIMVGFDKSDAGDRTESIFNDRSLEVGRDKSEKVGRNKTINVEKDHSEGVKGNMTITVAKNLTESVAINYAETVGAAMELTVGAALTEAVGLNKTQSVGSTKDVTVGKAYNVSVGTDMELTIGANSKQDVSENYELRVAGDAQQNVDKKFLAKAKSIQISADDDITLKTGSAQIIMKKNGDITIKGKKINVKGSGDVILKGSKVKAN